jgi:hypothetical protein
MRDRGFRTGVSAFARCIETDLFEPERACVDVEAIWSPFSTKPGSAVDKTSRTGTKRACNGTVRIVLSEYDLFYVSPTGFRVELSLASKKYLYVNTYYVKY